MSRILGSIGRGARRLARFAWWGLLLLPFLAIPAGYAVEYTSTPEFCNSCHIMEPFYEAWKSGTHSSIACVKCHFPPDVKGKLWTKYQAITQVVAYVTDTEATRPAGHIHDGSCIQCHARETLPVSKEYGGIRFAHGPHFDAARPGRELKCTSCHAQTTRDKHMAIDQGSCFLCHLKDQPPGEALGGCTSCHVLPATKVENEGLGFDHASVTARGMRCDACHQNVTQGTGMVTRNRCLECHADPAALAMFEKAGADPQASDELHHRHVKVEAVSCRSCHDEIVHGKDVRKRPHPAVSGDCASCHPKGHDLEATFAAGKGARGLTGKPDFMAHLGMSCESCHRGPPGEGSDPSAGCFACHGKGVRGMVDSWKAALEAWSATTEGDLAKVTAALGDTRPADAAQRLDDVRANVALVAKARGVHNIRYSEQIFRHARTTFEDVLKQSGKQLDLGPLPVPPGDQDCASCHVGAEKIEREYSGYPFPHAPHVGKARLACDDCHARGTPHGKLEMPVQNCTECHHSNDDEDCSKCHAPVARFYAGESVPGVAPKPDVMQKQVPCIACHADRAAKDQVAAVKKTCVECHDAKYGPMLDDWLKEGAALVAHLSEKAAAARVTLLDGDRNAAGYSEARTIVDEAEKLADTIGRGVFSHNPVLARQAAEAVQVRLAKVPDLVKSAK